MYHEERNNLRLWLLDFDLFSNNLYLTLFIYWPNGNTQTFVYIKILVISVVIVA